MSKMKQLNVPRALVVLSGGQDSTTCLYWACREYGSDNVRAVTFYYGQRHSVEMQAAVRIAKLAGLSIEQHEIINLGGDILASTSPLVSDNQLEQYKNHASLPGGIEKTFVPLRNQLFLTVAANRATYHGCTHVVTGVCQEDFGGYPDCRRVFIDSLEATINLSNEGAAPEITIDTPLMDLTKADSVKLATELVGCYGALAYSHTAYDGQYPPTGKDHATLLRAKGFEQAGIPDPLVLRAIGDGLMAIPRHESYNPKNIMMWGARMLREIEEQESMFDFPNEVKL